jgi:hypothetical protein
LQVPGISVAKAGPTKIKAINRHPNFVHIEKIASISHRRANMASAGSE